MDVNMDALEDIVRPVTAADTADQILREGAEHAARTIVALSTSAANENTRLRAAQYIIDRVCGGFAGDPDPWDAFLREVTGVSS